MQQCNNFAVVESSKVVVRMPGDIFRGPLARSNEQHPGSFVMYTRVHTFICQAWPYLTMQLRLQLCKAKHNSVEQR